MAKERKVKLPTHSLWVDQEKGLIGLRGKSKNLDQPAIYDCREGRKKSLEVFAKLALGESIVYKPYMASIVLWIQSVLALIELHHGVKFVLGKLNTGEEILLNLSESGG